MFAIVYERPLKVVALSLLGFATLQRGNSAAVAQELTGPVPQLSVGQKTAEDFAHEAIVALQDNQYGNGSELLRRAIAANPDDMGAAYDPWRIRRLDAARYEHGRRQLEKMLTDRPVMRKYVNPSDALWNWAVLKYAAKVQGSDVLWDSAPTSKPKTEGYAENVAPGNGMPGRIRLNDMQVHRDNDQQVFEMMWAHIVFELHNIENAQRFLAVMGRTGRGEITEAEFVKSMFVIECQAAAKTRKWYVEVYLPHAMKYNLATDPVQWYCTMWGTPEAQFSTYTDKNSYPWEPYSRGYKELRFFHAGAGNGKP